jgi:cyclohexanecarboxylate-CoA ligase
LLARTRTTIWGGAPSFLFDTIAAADRKGCDLPALRVVGCGGTSIPTPLVGLVRDKLGVPLRAGWGMTEIGLVTTTGSDPDEPPDWATESDGRPHEFAELDLRSDREITKDRPARLYARGPGVCLGTLGRDTGTLTVIAEHDDGWYDTGDLAVPDGRGGIRLMGRAADRVSGAGAAMIPVQDVESELLGHPGVADVALVGYPDGQGGERACAVITPATDPPVVLDELRKHLLDRGMTEWYLPTRVEYVQELPRNANGKIQKHLLRQRLPSDTTRAQA